MRQAAKRTLRGLCRVLVWPRVLMFRVSAIVLGREAAFRASSEAVSRWSGTWGVYLRYAFYGQVLSRCDDDACISFGTVFSHPDAEIGRCVYIGNHCSLGDVTLEDDVLLASGVSVMNGSKQHGTSRLDIPVREQAGVFEHVTIGQDTWVGERAVVAADVGRHCIVGAGAVVTRPVPDYGIVVGVPAKMVGDRRDIAARSNTPETDPDQVTAATAD